MVVYFIRDENNNVKIGHADNPSRRLRALQCATPSKLEILRVVEGGQKVEAWLHRRFAEYRLHGEWFAFRGEMLTVVPPDEVVTPTIERRAAAQLRPRMTPQEYFRQADRLGLLTEEMRLDYAPFLQERK